MKEKWSTIEKLIHLTMLKSAVFYNEEHQTQPKSPGLGKTSIMCTTEGLNYI